MTVMRVAMKNNEEDQEGPTDEVRRRFTEDGEAELMASQRRFGEEEEDDQSPQKRSECCLTTIFVSCVILCLRRGEENKGI